MRARARAAFAAYTSSDWVTSTSSGSASGSGRSSACSSGPCVISQAQRFTAPCEAPAMVIICAARSKTTTVASFINRPRYSSFGHGSMSCSLCKVS